jgi:hypothetical protein
MTATFFGVYCPGSVPKIKKSNRNLSDTMTIYNTYCR